MKKDYAVYKGALWPEVKRCIEMGAILAGGSLRCIVDDGEVVNDYDLFFPDKETQMKCVSYLLSCVARINCTRENNAIIEFKLRYEENAIVRKAGDSIQCVTHVFYGYLPPQRLIEQFDFTNSAVALTASGLFTGSDFADDVKNKKLRLQNPRSKANLMARAIKFVNRGYTIDKAEQEKMLAFFASDKDDKLFGEILSVTRVSRGC